MYISPGIISKVGGVQAVGACVVKPEVQGSKPSTNKHFGLHNPATLKETKARSREYFKFVHMWAGLHTWAIDCTGLSTWAIDCTGLCGSDWLHDMKLKNKSPVTSEKSKCTSC